jgi:hypothetical protein
LAPSEKAGTKTICPKCLKPLTIPAHDRMAAVDLESAIEPTHAEIHLASTDLGSLSNETGNAPRDYHTNASFYAKTEHDDVKASFEIDLDGEQNTASQTASCIVTPAPIASIKSFTPLPIPTAATYNRKMLSHDIRGMVSLTPTGLFSVDMAAQLSATLSMRMNPSPENSSERRVTTGAWILVTISAMLVWLAGVFFRPEWFICVALLGAALIVFGYAWRAYLVGRNGRTMQGLFALLPPVNAIVQLKSNEEHGHRPLRVVLAGVAILGLFFLGYDAHTAAAAAFKQAVPTVSASPPTSIAATIRDFSERQKDDQLLRYVRELPFSVAFRSASLEDKALMNEQLVKLTQSPRVELREVAIVALVECSPNEARKVILATLRGSFSRDHSLALAHADRLASPEIANAVVERLGDPSVGDQAETVTAKLGAVAEPALVAQLGAERTETAIVACKLLGKVGTAKSLKPLQRLADSSEIVKLKAAATEAIQQVKQREQISPERVSENVPVEPEPKVEEVKPAFARMFKAPKCLQ